MTTDPAFSRDTSLPELFQSSHDDGDDDDDDEQFHSLLHGTQTAARTKPFAAPVLPCSDYSAFCAPSSACQTPINRSEVMRVRSILQGTPNTAIKTRSCPNQLSDKASETSQALTTPLLQRQWKQQYQSMTAEAKRLGIVIQFPAASQTPSQTTSQNSTSRASRASRASKGGGGGGIVCSSADWTITSYLTLTQAPRFIPEKMWFLVYQREVCPLTGKEHWQGYVQYRKVVNLKAAQFMTGCKDQHMEPTFGSPKQNVAYCTKDDTRKPGTVPFQIGFLQPRYEGVDPSKAMYTYLKNNGVSDQVLLGLPELANVMAHQPVKSSSCVSPLSQQPVGLSNPTIISSHLILVLQGCSKVYTHVKFYFQFIFDIISVPAGTDQ